MKYIGLLLPLTMVGCGVLSSEPEATSVRLEISHTTIPINPVTGFATIPFVVHNAGRSTIYLSRCGDRVSTLVDRRENGRWVQTFSDVCPAVYDMSPLPLHGTDQYSSLRALHAPGQYRLRIGVTANQHGAYEWLAASPSFTIEASEAGAHDAAAVQSSSTSD